MTKTTKPVRLDLELIDLADNIAPDFHMKGSTFYNAVFRQGLASVRENGIQRVQNLDEKVKIDTQTLLKEGEISAKKGAKALNEWLDNLTPQEENAIKYSLKSWRAQAVDIENGKELATLPDLIKEGDRLSLWGRKKLLPWFDGLSKNVQKELKRTHWPKWRFDSGRADQHIAQGGAPLGYSTYHKFLNQNKVADDSGMTVEQKEEAAELKAANEASAYLESLKPD